MSQKEARKVAIIEDLLVGRFTNQQAAELLSLSLRQTQRLKSEAAANGVISLLHKNRGRKPINALDAALSSEIARIYQSELPGYNFCHVTDVLAEEKGIFLSVSTVARHLKSWGISSPKAKRRPKKHRARDARKQEGELAQMDASRFNWLGNESYLHLHGAIDDATGRILALHFEKEETFEGYCELIFQMNNDGHLPKELYTDGRTIFAFDSKTKQKLTLAEELAGKLEKQPHFARALKTLGILLIIARSAQAKGRIERLWETLQDRLAKDMRRSGITTVEEANRFLKRFLPYYNRKFSVLPVCPEKAYLPKQDASFMELTFAKHEIRTLDAGLSFSFQRRKYRLPLSTGNQRVSASARETITVATSRHLGIKVLYKGLVLTPELLHTPSKASHQLTEHPAGNSFPNPFTGSPAGLPFPWFDVTKCTPVEALGGDIFPEQLTP